MAATKKHQQLILLEPDKAAALDMLAKQTRIAKQALLRETVDDLLAEWTHFHAYAIDKHRSSGRIVRMRGAKI